MKFNNSRFYTLWTLVFVALLSGCFPSNNTPLQEVLLQGRTMGTTYNIKVVADPARVEQLQLQQAIDKRLVQVNQEMSTYIPDSELSLLNKADGAEAITLSEGLSAVIAESIRLGEYTNGSLDVTVGPLVNLWGFGPDARPEKVPSELELAKVRSHIGIDKVSLNGNQFSKAEPEVYVDLSTIAKGYGVDVIAELLESYGINRYLVEIGGEMRLKGFKSTGELWHVAVEKPVGDGSRQVHQIIVPQDNAVATSGDYRNYIEVDGKRYSHIIDPNTQQPIDHKLVSVTVIHPSAMTADGLSTAIMVMGPERGLAFAQERDLAAMLIVKEGDGFVELNTVKFVGYLK